MNQGRVESFALDDNFGCERISLPEAISQDLNRTDLELSVAGMREVTDAEVALIADGLPPNLINLDLNFESPLDLVSVFSRGAPAPPPTARHSFT